MLHFLVRLFFWGGGGVGGLLLARHHWLHGVAIRVIRFLDFFFF